MDDNIEDKKAHHASRAGNLNINVHDENVF